MLLQAYGVMESAVNLVVFCDIGCGCMRPQSSMPHGAVLFPYLPAPAHTLERTTLNTHL